VLALHGFGSGNPRIDSYMLFAAQCFDHGMDVALLTLPSHGARTPPNATFSGERFGMPHGAAVNEVVRQAVYGIHMVSGWLRQQTGMPVGLLGMSLGGYLSALMAGLTDEWAFVIPMVPPVCMGDLAARRLPIVAMGAWSDEQQHNAECQDLTQSGADHSNPPFRRSTVRKTDLDEALVARTPWRCPAGSVVR
jgi:dienelactone hydrolase